MADDRPELSDAERIEHVRQLSETDPSNGTYTFEKPDLPPPTTAAAGDGPVRPAPVAPQQQSAYPGLETGFAGRLDKLRSRLSTDIPDVEFRVVSGFRSDEEQAALYEKLGAQHLAAPPGGSYHNYGGAVDLGVYRDGQRLGHDEAAPYLKRAADMAGDFGITPGFYFNTPDHPHFQAGPAGGLADWKAGINLPNRRGDSGGSGVLPPLDQAISNASQQTGVPIEFLRGEAMVESNGGRNLGSGKHIGPFAFDEDTAASVGLGDRMDFGQSALGAAKLALANKTKLERMLGRDVSWDEVYLAHQQGAGGAQALLDNPSAKASDLVGAGAVTGNGGTLDMTGGQFANMIMAKYRRASTGNFAVSPAPGRQPAPYVPPSVVEAAADTYKSPPLVSSLSGDVYPDPEQIKAFGSTLPSAFTSMENAGGATSQANSSIEAVSQRNQAIKNVLGLPDLELDNPADTGSRQMWAIDHGVVYSPLSHPEDAVRIDALREQAYQEQLGELAQRFPDKAAALQADRPFREVTFEDAVRIGRAAKAEAAAAYEAAPPGIGRTLGSFTGEAAGFMYSPMGALSLAPFGTGLKAASILGKLMIRGAQEAAVNFGLTLGGGLLEKDAWREAMDRPTDMGGRVEEATQAAALGAVFGMVMQGGHGLISRMFRGDLEAGAEAAAHLPKGTESSLPATVVSEALDRQARPQPIAGGPPTEMPKPAIGADGKLDASPLKVEKPGETADGKPLRIAAIPPEEVAQKLREHIRNVQDPELSPKPDLTSLALDPPPAPPGPRRAPPEMPIDAVGTPLEMAHALRQDPALWDATMLMDEPAIKQAQGLARLSDDAWQKVVNGEIDPIQASAVGRMAADSNLHADLIESLKRHQPPNETQARLMIGDELEALNRRDGYDQMAGRDEMTSALSLERAQVFQRSLGAMAKLMPERSERELNLAAVRLPEASAALNRWSAELSTGQTTLHAAGVGFARDMAELHERGVLVAPPHEPRLPDIVADTPQAKQAQTEALQAALPARQAAPDLDRHQVAAHLEPALMREWRSLTDTAERLSVTLREARERAATGAQRPGMNERIAARQAEVDTITGKVKSETQLTKRAAAKVAELRTEIDELKGQQRAPTGDVARLEARAREVDLARRDMAPRVSERLRQADEVLKNMPKREEAPAAAEATALPGAPKPEAADVRKSSAPTPAAKAHRYDPEAESKLGTLLSRDSRTIEAAERKIAFESGDVAKGEIAKAAEAAGLSRSEGARLEARMAERAPSSPAGAPEVSDRVPITGSDGNTKFITREEVFATPREEALAEMLEACKL